MKKKLSKLLGIALTLALVTSLVVAVAPAAALSQPQVSIPFTQNVIDTTTEYTLTFTAGAAVPNGGQIIITFPAGTDISNVLPGDVNVEALAGIGGGPADMIAADAVASGNPGAPQVLTITLGASVAAKYIGQGSLVGITIANVTNPATPGDYTLTVATKDDSATPKTVEAAVTSATYSIIPPTITPLPGVAYAYNSAGILMKQSNKIQDCINAAGIGGKVEVGPGTYDEELTVGANAARQTIVASVPGQVIIKDVNMSYDGALDFTGTITVDVAGSATLGGVTIDGFTFAMPVVGGPEMPIIVDTNATYVTITNCIIEVGAITGIAVMGGSDETTVSNCNIDATSDSGSPIGIMADAEVAITGCTFTVGSSTNSAAIQTNGGIAAPFEWSTISDSTITGSSGAGIAVGAGACTIDNVEISMVDTALLIVGGTVVVKNSTIDQCGGPFTNQVSPIIVADWTAVTVEMYNNTIQNSSEYKAALTITETGPATAGVTLTAHNNNFVNNKKQVANTDGNGDGGVSITHNWWGASSGPVAGSVTGVATTAPYLTSSVTKAGLALGTSKLEAKSTVGVDVLCLLDTGGPANVGTIAVSKYSANPELNAPRIAGTGGVLGYYDVYVTGGTPSSIQVKIYGTVNKYCKLYYAGGLVGEWVEVSAQGVNTAGGYVYATISSSSLPSITDLGGTPFALVEDKTTIAGPSIAADDGGNPVIGAYDVSVTPMFTWYKVTGSLSYEIELSEEPNFDTIVWSNGVDHTFYKVMEALNYSTTYYWRVRGVLAESYEEDGVTITPATPWTTGIFTT
jgi:hypothetical protein